MPDNAVVISILKQIENAGETVLRRTENVQSADFFTDSPEGMEKLDGICMQFIAIGESLKNIDKITGGQLLSRYDEIAWKDIMGFRDIISHHYFDIDADHVFWICRNELLPLLKAVRKIIADIQRTN